MPIATKVPEQISEAIKQALINTPVPELNKTAWDAVILKDVTVDEKISVSVVLPSFGLRSEQQIAFAIKNAVMKFIDDPAKFDLYVYSDVKPAAVQSILQKDIADVRNVILVSSGKGGVGKSTVASNLAVAMAGLGCRVGLLDADVYGPSIPLMFGVKGEGEVKGFLNKETNTNIMIPPIKYDVPLMSIGFLVDVESPMIWRGPMIASASMQMFHNVYWGQLDYLIVDLPPGTGDIQLTIAQKINVAGAIIVSTPQDMALADVIRAKKMFDKVNIPTLGLIENMSYFVCDSCDKRHEIFANGGAKIAADKLGIKVLGEIPLVTSIRTAGDLGTPAALNKNDNALKPWFTEIAHDLCADMVMRGSVIELPNNTEHNQIKKNVPEPEKKRRLTVL